MAEKHMVWRSRGSTPTMRRMAGRNPMSSMRSASSRTSTLTWRRSTSLRPRKSSSRPGVATSKRAPERIASNWPFSPTPPITSAAGEIDFPRNCSNCSCTCMASSRVGTSTRASMVRDRGVCSSRSIIGTRKASVLPVPVWAVAIRSLPASACGIAADWIGMGV